jgi:hypothetical protein
MDFRINSWRFLWNSGYNIENPNVNYSVRNGSFFSSGFQLFSETDEVLVVAFQRVSIYPKFDLNFQNGVSYKLENYRCEGNGESYVVYPHRGRNFSFFQGERQIGAFAHDMTGSSFSLRLNHDANLPLMICLLLAVDADAADGVPGVNVSIDLGNIGIGCRAFDESWQPT